VPVTASAPAGKYRLQVAAVRSRDEAERLASSVMKHQALNGGAVQPEIDEAVLGSMGTFYRVRLGPYANAAEPGQLCKSLRPQGFDCLVVTQ
jgi:cell division septation protein DedD